MHLILHPDYHTKLKPFSINSIGKTEIKVCGDYEIACVSFDFVLNDSTLLLQVCPLCAANLGKDVIGHFIVQHASSLKVLLNNYVKYHFTQKVFFKAYNML